MIRDAVMNLRLPAEVKAAVMRAAEDDMRSMASMTVKILSEWLTERGYLGEPKQAAAPKRQKRS